MNDMLCFHLVIECQDFFTVLQTPSIQERGQFNKYAPGTFRDEHHHRV